jgi:hypothetical protein
MAPAVTYVSGTKRVRLVNGELQILEAANDEDQNDLKLVVSVPLLPDHATNLALELNAFAKAKR